VTSPGKGPSKGAGADLPTETIPAVVAPSRRPNPSERLDIPEIVPATDDPQVGTVGSGNGGPPTVQHSVLPRVISRRPRVRRVTRVVRHLDPWSVFKVATLFHFAAYLVTLTSGALLWRVAASTGTLDNVERWFTQFGWETFELDGGEVYHNAWIAGLFLVVAMTGVTVLLATLFNLISDLVGGVRVSVLEEEVVATGPTRTSIRRSDQRREGGRLG